jgi:hypothetical protein
VDIHKRKSQFSKKVTYNLVLSSVINLFMF